MNKDINLRTLVGSLSENQKKQLIWLLKTGMGFPSPEEIEENATNSFACPHCHSKKIHKNGHVRGLQRYRCRECSKTFGLTTNTVFHRSKKSLALWAEYAELLLEKKSLRSIAQTLGISLSTSFFWRHKILRTLEGLTEQIDPMLDGIIEADETYFRLSFKGQRSGLPRPAKRRGTRARKAGISKEQVCVLTAVDRAKNSRIDPVCLGRPTGAHIEGHFDGHITHKSTLVTDKHSSYKRYCRDAEISHVQVSCSQAVDGVYHIQNVNSLHNELKHSLQPYRGVATKYLKNYLVLFEWSRRSMMKFVKTFRVHNTATYESLRCAKMCLA